MNRREFLLKLGKSVLVITAVTATGILLKKEGDPEACADESSCAGCASLQRCGLPKRNAYVNRSEYMKQNDQSQNGASMNSTVHKRSTENV